MTLKSPGRVDMTFLSILNLIVNMRTATTKGVVVAPKFYVSCTNVVLLLELP